PLGQRDLTPFPTRRSSDLNGDTGNQGVHEMDIARWALGGTLPRSVVSLGGRYVDESNFKDQGETPNQLVSVFDYGDALLLFETRDRKSTRLNSSHLGISYA